MDKDVKFPFLLSYERDAKGSYLVISLDKDQYIYHYQVEMMINNEIPTLLPFNIRQKDNLKYLYYNVTSRLQIKQLLSRRKLNLKELNEILIEMIQGILDSGNYLLQPEGFIIDEDFVFVHPETLQVSLLYIPCRQEKVNTIDSLRQLVYRIISFMEIRQEGDEQLILKILFEINKETFNLADFLQFLRQSKMGVVKGKGASLSEAHSERGNKIAKKEIANVTTKESIGIEEDSAKGHSIVGGSRTKTLAKKVYSRKVKLIMLLSEMLLLIMLALLFFETNIIIDAATGEIDKTSVIGLLILVGVINVILTKKLLVPENLITIVQPQNNKATLNMDKKEINNVSNEIFITGRSLNYSSNIKTPKVNFPEESFDTELIEVMENPPKLIAMEDHKIITINTDPFIIGKLKDQVDCVLHSKAISRVHVEINSIEGKYYLKDLNSKNGTFINGERINSNIDHLLKDGDKVSFADLSYIFAISPHYCTSEK